MFEIHVKHLSSPLTFEYDPPGGEEGLEERHSGDLVILLVVVVQAREDRLDGQVSEAVGGGGKHIGDTGVHVRVVARVGAQRSRHGFITHDVGQVVPVHKHLRMDTC